MSSTWTPSWSVFESFPRRPGAEHDTWMPSWVQTRDWITQVQRNARHEATAIGPLLELWDAALAPLGGDPARERWENFRPLRLSREEDWSDWLAFLLRASEGRCIADKLFPPSQHSSSVDDVLREEWVLAGGRRADLVLLWSSNRASHVEVKVWDENFAKTVETGAGCRAAFPDRSGWIDYVLLPDESEDAWAETDGVEEVKVVTWTTLCRELRRALLISTQSFQWVAFARAFCGAIEQKILGAPPVQRGEEIASSAALFRFGRILRGASGNGDER